MSRVLSVTNKLLSLRGGIDITDQHGNTAYRATGSFALFSPTWRIYQDGAEVASVRKRIFAIVPTWDFEGKLGAFTIRRKIFSFVRRYYTVGGPVDGAVIVGNLLDLRFRVTRGELTLAQAAGRVFTIHDRHQIEVLEEPELFAVLAMLVVQLDRRDARRRAAFDSE